MKRIAHLTIAGVVLLAAAAASAKQGNSSVLSRASGHSIAVTRAIENLTIENGDLPSWDGPEDPNNVTWVIDLGAPGETVDGIGWEVALMTMDVGDYGGSWLSEATVAFLNVDGDGVELAPGAGDNFAANGVWTPYSSAGLIDLVDLDLDFEIPDGKLYIEFFEGYDDEPDTVDAWYQDGGIFGVSYTPEPASLLLITLGGLISRRR